MKKLSKIGLSILILFSAIVAAVLMIVFKPVADKAQPAPLVPAVDVLVARPEDIKLKIPSQGIIEPIRQTRIAAEVAGKVVWVSERFESGERFEAGETLLRIDDTDYRAALADARAALAEAVLALEQEDARAEQARRDWEKLGASEAASGLVMRVPHLESARARVTSAEAAVTKAQKDVDRTELQAPFNGRIRSTFTDLGSYATPGTALAEIYAVDTLEIRLPLSIDDYAYVEDINRDGAKYPEVKLKTTVAGESYEWDARVVRTEGQVDRSSRSVYLVANIDTAELEEKYAHVAVDLVAPGLFVNAEISGRLLEGVYRVPRTAFYTPDTVAMVNSDGELYFRRDVKWLRADGNGKDLIVAKGVFEPDEIICVTPPEPSIEGMKVQVAAKEAGGAVRQADAGL